MEMSRVVPVLVVTAACASAPPHAAPRGDGSSLVASGSAAPVEDNFPVAPMGLAPQGELTMHPVARIYSLIDLWSTGDGVELRLGSDPGGGMHGFFRFVPLSGGVPDFSRETNKESYVNTAILPRHNTTSGGFIELVGRRPRLVLHKVWGFRSAATDAYSELDDYGQWHLVGYDGETPDVGFGLAPWSEGRLLEFRSNPQTEEFMGSLVFLPRMRVLGPKAHEAPSVPDVLKQRLEAEGFTMRTFRVLPSGEVVVVGELMLGTGFGTLIWRADLDAPSYTVTAAELAADAELSFLGGDSLPALRLAAGDRVMKLAGDGWVEESRVAAGSLPDVWFGAPQLLQREDGVFARFARGGPWQRVGVHSESGEQQSFAMSPDGTLYKTEDDLLLASHKPKKAFYEISEDELVKGRKASVLRGGSDDATGEPANAYSMGMLGGATCSMRFVLLHSAPAGKQGDVYARVVQALQGMTELVNAKFLVSRERGLDLFGVQVSTYELAKEVADRVGSKVAGVMPQHLCAEPTPLRVLKVDLLKGVIVGGGS